MREKERCREGRGEGRRTGRSVCERIERLEGNVRGGVVKSGNTSVE